MAKVALLIGISEYQEPTLAPLPKAVEDVEAMRRVLKNPEMGGFDDVKTLTNAPRQEMAEAIEELYAKCQKDDLVLLYFSGHGVTVDNGEFYFSTRITRKDAGKLRTASAIAAKDVHGWMNSSKSKRRVVILDCCFSGAFAKGLIAKNIGTIDLQQQLGGEGTAILTASTSTQYAFASDELDLSIYTQYLVEGIEKGAADKDGDGFIAVDELHDYAKTKVQEASPAMTPEFYPFKDGYRIFLAKSPKDDPKLKYRKEVEQRAKLNQGKLSVFALELLESKRLEWQLSDNEARAILEEVLQPYREYERKRERYEQALIRAVNEERYPFNELIQKDLHDYQQYLGLRDEDIQAIKQLILAPKEAEYQRQQEEIERLLQEQQRAEYQRQETERLRQEEQRRRDAERLRQEQQNTKSTQGIQTRTFEFKTATITGVKSGFLGIGKSCEISRRRGSAEFFTEDLGNGVVLEMVSIPGGTFLMGSPESGKERRDSESPQHNVNVQPFFMGKFPVTQGQWQAVAALDKVNIDLDSDPSRFKGTNRPVERVSWDHAVEFCARLSKKTGKIYRLPSEAEWEYACRAGTTTPFYFGETITTELANYNGNYTYGSAPKGKYREQTTDVGEFPANPFGLFDMCGNVWEWCEDEWHGNYNNAPIDGSAWVNENNNQSRLLRGGSWDSYPRYCRSANRGGDGRDGRGNLVGFRVVVVRGRAS
ncbi:MAG: SUMF1/EgtB/PvdO family nonheme iron enzyme [Nostoc sp. TH1S01]|nr:SUMF1/EgtB/PvdO family nonheme iron enzyme [Nostoc sp. TH1S01]